MVLLRCPAKGTERYQMWEEKPGVFLFVCFGISAINHLQGVKCLGIKNLMTHVKPQPLQETKQNRCPLTDALPAAPPWSVRWAVRRLHLGQSLSITSGILSKVNWPHCSTKTEASFSARTLAPPGSQLRESSFLKQTGQLLQSLHTTQFSRQMPRSTFSGIGCCALEHFDSKVSP